MRTEAELEEIARAAFARCATDGHAVIRHLSGRMEAEALRAELRRLAREFSTRVATIRGDDDTYVVVARRDRQPWDATEEEMLAAFDAYLSLGQTGDAASDPPGSGSR